jgi:hypothetical protein
MNAYILCRDRVGQVYSALHSRRRRRQRTAGSGRHSESKRRFYSSACRRADRFRRLLVSHIDSQDSEQAASAGF